MDCDDDDDEVQMEDDCNTDQADVVQQLGQSEIFEDLRSVLNAEYGSYIESDSDNSDFNREISWFDTFTQVCEQVLPIS